MLSADEVKVLDINSEYHGVPTSTLMENAGKGVAHHISSLVPTKNKRILVLCGPGNNGGDGLVAARYLVDNNYMVNVVLVSSSIKTRLAQINFERLSQQDIHIYYLKDLTNIDEVFQQHDVLVDAMLGVGLTGDLREPYKSLVQKINLLKNKMIIAVDTPTGLGTALCLRPQYTITFHAEKEHMNQENSGIIHLVDIGIPKEAELYVGPGDLTIYYPRPLSQSHKGDNGSVLIIGGGPYTGAPALAGLAALRTGVDLVYIATPHRSWKTIASFSPNFIVHELSSNYLVEADIPVILDFLKRCTGVIIGPGLGTKKETESAIIPLIQHIRNHGLPLVIDADAIQPVGIHPECIQNSSAVITPHAGEFKKLTGITLSDDINVRIEHVKTWAKKLGITILLKGPVDVLTDGNYYKLNTVHNEAMTVGGTGDVLAGITGAFVAKHVSCFNAIRMSSFLNGAAGNEAFKKKMYGLLATDIIEEIPTILKQYIS